VQVTVGRGEGVGWGVGGGERVLRGLLGGSNRVLEKTA